MKATLILIFLCLTVVVKAQISIGGTPPSFIEGLPPAPIYTLGSINNDSLIAEIPSGFEEDSSYTPKHFFAINIPNDISMTEYGVWETLSDGREVWRLTIESPTALGVSLMLKQFSLPEDAELYFYDAEYQQVSGAFTSLSNKEDSIFIPAFIIGNLISIEYVHPIGGILKPNFILKEIIHAFRDPTGRFNQSLDCHNNVVCPDFNDYCNQIRSVCLIHTSYVYKWSNCNTTTYTTWWSSGSGALINNSSNDFRPYLLTARHVIWDVLERHWCVLNYSSTSGFTDVANTLFYFNYQSRNCELTTYLSNENIYFMRGARVVESEAGKPIGSDLALLELHDRIPIQFNVYFSGWNRQSKDDLPSWDVTGIHHPRGDMKKISKGNLHYSLVFANYWGVDWWNGVTEAGSSGSPLFCDGDRRIIGALSFGANDNCDDHNQQDRYGRLRSFWNKVNDELSPDDVNRETFSGANPATHCQENIDINGELMPYSLYDVSQPLINIRASNNINIANLETTRTFIRQGLSPVYHISAGNIINIEPTGNDHFATELGTELILEINECESTPGCGNGIMERSTNTSDRINTNQTKKSFSVQTYPNPNSGSFTLKMNILDSYQIKIYNTLGELVYSVTIKNSLEHPLNLNISSGLYYINVINSSGETLNKTISVH